MTHKPLFGSAQNIPNALGFFIFPDGKGSEPFTHVYEDAGDTIGNQATKYSSNNRLQK
jgi:hypothetical protein